MEKKTESRFDYIKYDELTAAEQAAFKNDVTFLEDRIEACLPSRRAKSLALTKLEECYMWIGKGLRDRQIEQNGKAELEESR